MLQRNKMEAAIFFDSYLPNALRRAQDYAGSEGFVASLPQLLHARTSADYGNVIWNTWFNPNTEENVFKTPQGNPVLVTVHGGGLFASPDRFEALFRASTARFCELGFTGLFAGKITEAEAHDLLRGRLPDGEIPVYTFEEFRDRALPARGAPSRPLAESRYAVVMDFGRARRCKSGYHGFEELKEDPLMIVRAGGVEAAAAYLDKAAARRNTSRMGCWHPFHHIDPNQPQTRVPNLAGNKGYAGSEDDDGHLYGYDADYGIGGDSNIHNTSMINIARYVAVAPRNAATSLRHLPFVR